MANILQLRNLKTCFYSPSGITWGVDGVSFDVEKGGVFGLVGESGSGKTVTALSILRLIFPPGKIMEGSAIFTASLPGRKEQENSVTVPEGKPVNRPEPVNGTDLLKLDETDLRNIRGSKISIVFQEPSSALNPVFTVGFQIAEAILAHQRLAKADAEKLAIEFLGKVHIPQPERVYHSYPHQLSGGLKQRAMIAMALVNSPELLILDEPTTALDVTIQAGILDLLDEIIDREKMSALFISHDFGIISRMCDRVAVMYKGKIVEEGGKSDILNNPKEPNTETLLESVKALS